MAEKPREAATGRDTRGVRILRAQVRRQARRCVCQPGGAARARAGRDQSRADERGVEKVPVDREGIAAKRARETAG